MKQSEGLGRVVEIFIGVHNISSPQRLKDIAKIVFGTSVVKGLVITKPAGLAAQSALPEVMAWAYKLSRTVLVFPTLQDAIDLLAPSSTYIISRVPRGELPDVLNVLDNLSSLDRVLFVVHGEESNFSRDDLARGTVVCFKSFSQPIGPVAEVSILVHELVRRFSQSRT